MKDAERYHQATLFENEDQIHLHLANENLIPEEEVIKARQVAQSAIVPEIYQQLSYEAQLSDDTHLLGARISHFRRSVIEQSNEEQVQLKDAA